MGLFLYLEMNLSFCFVSKYSTKNFFFGKAGILREFNKKP